MRYQAVLFDFDYTLGDSTGPIAMGYRGGLTAMGWPPPTVEQVRPTIGHTLQDGYTMLTGDDSEDRRSEFFHRFQEAVGEQAVLRGNAAMITETKLLPGARELLVALKEAGAAAGVVSTKLGVTIRAIFSYNGMEGAVWPVIGGEDVISPKPDPQGLNTALAQLSLRPNQVLFCGDTVIDARTAQAAGTDFCAVLNGTTPAEAFGFFPCVHIAPDLWELKEWLFDPGISRPQGRGPLAGPVSNGPQNERAAEDGGPYKEG